MMDHYIEIKILPAPEFPASTLMNALVNKLHKALFDLEAKDIGISFPTYDKSLGLILRVHGTAQRLSQLEQTAWIGRMQDYCDPSAILKVPDKVKHRTISRRQDPKSNAKLKRLLERQSAGKRGSRPELTKEGVLNYQQGQGSQAQTGPFLTLQSSKGQRYRRYLIMGELQDNPVSGEFNQFGLSKTATIPWF